MMITNNIFANIPFLEKGEIFSLILQCQNVVIEKIISSNIPNDHVYNQEQDEWVILLQGKASLKIKNDIINLEQGDYIFIPANTTHQVLKTSVNPVCIWLAVHIYLDKKELKN